MLTSALALVVAIAAAPRHAAAYSAITLHTGASGGQIGFFGDDLLVGVPSTGTVQQIDVQTATVVRTFSDPAPGVGNLFGAAVQAVGANIAVGAPGNGGAVYLFGDGSVRLAYTPGHSAGHQSVICRLSDRDFVIAGDVIYTLDQLKGGPEPARPYDRHNWRRSMRELQLFSQQYPQAVIVPGHDPFHWETLKKRYE